MGIFKRLFNNQNEETPEEVKKEILIESWSPVCNIQAFVEKSKSTIYFYLWVNPGTESSLIKPCWVCNTTKAKEKIDYEAMNNGSAPKMPLQYCSNSEGMKVDKDNLSIIWFQEGDAAALLENNRLLAVIPGWSGNEFHGYSRYAVGTGPFAWELAGAEDTLYERVMESEKYWEYLHGDYFKDVQYMHLSILENFFGTYENYYTIDNNKFPPKGLITGRKNKVNYAFTVGVSVLCQPRIEQYLEDRDAEAYRRIELGVACSDDFKNKEGYMELLNYISGQTTLPWREINWLGNGHTIPCNAINNFEAVLLINDNMFPQINSPKYDAFMGERVNLLWVIPITKEEYNFVRNNGSAKLIEKYSGNLENIIVFDEKSKFI
jgi:hypothetical protein